MREVIERMGMDEFVHLCNRLVMEMGFKIRNSVYRGDIAVFDAYMPLPGKSLHYVVIFIKRPRVSREEVLDMIDFDTVEVRWMLITTGNFEDIDDLRSRDDITFMEWKDFERLLREFGMLEEMEREKRGEKLREGRILPSLGEQESMLQWAQEFFEEGNYERALEYVENAVKIKATPTALKMKSRILERMGRYEEALSILKDVLEENVEDDEAWLILGEILEDMDDLEEAVEAYGQCIRFNRMNVACWINRGNVMLLLEKYQEALMCYDKALALRRDLPQVWNNRGVALKHMGKYDGALRSYNLAIEIDPEFADGYLNKAYLYFDLRRYEEARNAIEEFLKRRDDARGWILLAKIHLKRNFKKEAKEALERALRIEPGNQEAKELLDRIEGRGKGERELRRMKKALKEVKNILYGEIENLEQKYNSLGVENGEIEGALKEIKNLVDREEIPEALDMLLSLERKINDLESKTIGDLLQKDTRILLELAEMEVENINNLSLKELEILREDAMKRILISKIEKAEEIQENRGMDVGEIQRLEREIIREVSRSGEFEAMGHILYEEGKWDEIKKIKDVYAYNGLGLKNLNQRRYKRAMDYFIKALRIDPKFKYAEFNLAYALLMRGEKRKAKALLKHLRMEEYMEKMKK